MNILLGASGSVAAIKYQRLYSALKELGDVKGVLTERAKHFVYSKHDGISFNMYTYTDYDEWQWKNIGDTVKHIELRDWADVFIIAPLSANTMAKMANGLCDNLLTSIYRAWPVHAGKKQKHLILAPAMNTEMWDNPITQKHLHDIANIQPADSHLVHIINPVESTLACGSVGIGAMAPLASILDAVRKVK